MQKHVGNYFYPQTSPPPTSLWLGQNSTVSEHGHVAYQNKWNRKCRNMQAHILSLHTPSTLGVGQMVKTFFSESSHAAYQINGNGA